VRRIHQFCQPRHDCGALRDVNDGYAALKDGSLTRIVATSF
jgi:hypothetical protein